MREKKGTLPPLSGSPAEGHRVLPGLRPRQVSAAEAQPAGAHSGSQVRRPAGLAPGSEFILLYALRTYGVTLWIFYCKR